MKYLFFVLFVLPHFILLSLFFVTDADAATTRPVGVDPASISAFLFTPNNLDGVVLGRFETIATTPQNQQVTRYTSRSVPVPKARLGALARSAVGGPAVLAATSAFLAYDYFFNEDTQEWEVSGAEPEAWHTTDVGTLCQSPGIGPGNQQAGISMSTCFNHVRGTFGAFTPGAIIVSPTGNHASFGYIQYCMQRVGASGCGNANFFRLPRSFTQPTSPFNPYPSPATDTQLGDAIKNAPAPTVQDILNDPISTGTWRDRWPELEPVTQEIEDQLGHDIEGGPVPVNPDQTITDGSTYNPPQTDTGSGGSMSTEWPTFCSWAGVVCEFIDWVQEPFAEPPPVEVPYVDIDFEEDYDSGIAIAQCPAPIAMNITLGSSVRAINFEWAPLCTFADTVRPLIIAFSYLIGIYILLRVK